MQETFLRVIRRLPELDVTRLNLSAYLHTTARNLFYKQAERAKRVQLEERMEDVAPAADVLEEDPERAALLDAQQVEVRDATCAWRRASAWCWRCGSSRIARTPRSARSSA